MDTETSELGRQMLARKLISQHAERCGYPTQANWAHWALHSEWLELPQASRGSFWDYVIRTLSRQEHST
jgi:hypothetical protein